MYTALAERRIICSEKMVLKLGFVLMALAVFSTRGLPIASYETGGYILNNYVQDNFMKEEHENYALFLRENWEKELKLKYQKINVKKIEEGVIYVPIVKYINNRRVKMNVVEVNRNINKNLEIIPKSASANMHSKSRINKIASGQNTIVAVNGTYFKQDTGTPLGALVVNNEIISGPIYERAGLGIGSNGFKTSRISFAGEIKTKDKVIKINNINQPRMMFTEVLLYTSKWGAKSPATKKPSLHLAVKNNKIIAKSTLPILIPEDGYVISAPKEAVNNLKTGDKVKINYSVMPKWDDVEHIISGGPFLVKNGSIFVDAANEKLTAISGRNPRTAIGYTRDNVMIIVTVDGRKEGSSGVTLNELAKIMKDLGCYEAINLDGGSSTVMYINGTILSGSNIKNSAMISNALVVKRKV